MLRCFGCLTAILVLMGCSSLPRDATKTLQIPHVSAPFTVDGKLDEACYRQHAPLTAFVVAGDHARVAPPTRAWVFWNEEKIVCAFECADATPAFAAPTDNERDVDGQDRAEVFLWNGDPNATYYCIEAAPGGAVHDYAARFYRHFDSSWSPGNGWICEAALTATGYTVEMAIPKAVLEAMGLQLRAGYQFRIGLFRADFDVLNGQPTWITWIDHGREPDFHLAESFGTARLNEE